MKIPKWQKKLTAEERKHIKETTDGGLLREFKSNAIAQKKWREKGMEPCWKCKFIAEKLGFEV